MKIEPSQLTGYLPYGLETTEGTLTGIVKSKEGFKYMIESENANQILDTCIPILRPISDLVKEIEIDGVLIVPIEYLVNMLDDSDLCDFYGDVENPIFQADDDWIYSVSCSSEDSEMCFSFDSLSKSFILTVDFDEQFVSNQLAMFEKLYEWKFDVHELIDEGLAIDINQNIDKILTDILN